MVFDIALGGGHVSQGARGLHVSFHGHEHAPNVGVMHDGRTLLGTGYLALNATAGVIQCPLVGPLSNGDPLYAHRQAGMVHHGEHTGQALIFPADQIAYGAALVAIAEHTCGAAMNAQLVLHGNRRHVVAPAQGAVRVDQVFGDQKQRNTPHARRGIG